MQYYDFHTHQPKRHPEDVAVLSVDIRETGDLFRHPATDCTQKNELYAVGVHPWYIDANDRTITNLLFAKVRQSASRKEVVAIGETGLDKKFAKSAGDYVYQQEIFISHIRLAEEVKKPVIIHCVKAWDDVLQIRRSIQPSMPWIIHGFRGKESLARQLIGAGFYLSFGPRYNREALQASWAQRRLFLETDDQDTDIRDVYQQVANDLNITEQVLSEAIENRISLFF